MLGLPFKAAFLTMNLEGLRPVSKASLSDKIVDQITDLISRDVLKPGERLPSERDLCTMFGVGRTSVREALRSLSVMGILDGRVGEGTFVCDNSSKYLEKSMQWGLLLDRKTVQDLIETRLMLETETASLAAQRATPADVRGIGAALAAMEDSIDADDRFLEHDLSFHLLMARATQNPILNNLLTMIRTYLQEWIKGSLAEPTSREKTGRARKSLAEHREIFNALQHGDEEGCRKAMKTHIISSSVDLRSHVDSESPN
jgi:GntR family transcriptional repressor for pyruvate dehydrogenase complex